MPEPHWSGRNPSTTTGGSGALATRPATVRPPTRARHTMISAFQSGHGWVVNNAATSNANDTSTYLLGSQGITLTTNGTGTAVTVKRTGMTAIDLSTSIIKFWIMLDDVTNLSQIQVYAGDTNFTNFISGTVLDNLGSVLPFASGEWAEVQANLRVGGMTATGSPNTAAITDIQFRITDKAVGATTVHLSGIAYYPDPTQFPIGVVSIAFDDSYAAQYTEGRKKLDQYSYPATAYVIADKVDTAGYLTLAQLTELQNLHGWEIAGHAYTTSNHDNDFFGNPTVADTDLSALKQWLIQNGFKGHNQFAYPHGSPATLIQTSEPAAKKYFASGRSTIGTPRQSLPPEASQTHRIRSYIVNNTTTTATVQTEIDKAYTAKTWLILIFHNLVTTPTLGTEYSIANFGTIVDYMNTKGIPVRTVGDVLASLGAQ